jgi:carbon-monoxide dehydrogenase medium subunit
VPMLNLRLARPSAVVDISGLSELITIEISPTEISIGAMVTHAALECGAHAGPTFDLLRRVAGGIAYRGIRNRGTIGGSIAHADPAADWPSCLLALDASVTIAGANGPRRLPIADFFVASFTTALLPGELVTRINIAPLGAHARWGYYKHNRKIGEFAKAIGCFIDDPTRPVRRIVAGALSSPPVVLFAEQGGWPAEISIASIRAEVQAVAPNVEGAHIHFHAAAVMRAIQGRTQP